MLARSFRFGQLVVLTGFTLTLPLWATQPGQEEKQQPDKKGPDKKDFFKGFGPGGFGPPGMQQRKLVAQFDKNKDGWLNADERQPAREFLKKERASGKGGFGPGGFGGKGKGPAGFSPGGFFVKPLLDALDADQDGKLSKAELLAGVKRFMAEADQDKAGAVDEGQLAEAINRLLPAPPGFPGGNPPFGGPPPRDGEKKDDKKSAKKGDPKGERKEGPPGGFMRFGPGNALARGILLRADPKKTGRATLEQLNAAAASLFQEIDKDQSGKLDESAVAAGIGMVFPPPGGPGGFGKGPREPGRPGPKVTPAEVKSYPDADLYDTSVLRTLFLEFENQDWEMELQDFHGTDVEVPGTLLVDGKKYLNVGVHFRGMSSYMGTPAGSRRSLNLTLDLADSKQRLYKHKTLNLLNSADDPSFMHTVLFSHVSRQYIPAPRANFVKVVINGESWGVYVSAEQFNKEFVAENFKTAKGARWKIKGSPGGRGGLDYLGDHVEDYKRIYTIKSGDNAKDWQALIELCRTLGQTPLDKLEAALEPMLDIDGVLWFLALDNALINDDGYWIRASDYCLYRDPKGKFHLIAHDINESFMPAMGPGMVFGPGMGKGGFGGPKGGPEDRKRGPDEPGKRPEERKGPPGGAKAGPVGVIGSFGGMGRSGLDLDPLIGMDDPRKPLRSRLLQVPSLRAKYLAHVKTIATDWLDWKKLGPIVAQHRALIEKEVEIDTRKLYSLDAFRGAVADQPAAGSAPMGRGISLRAFADGRREYLLNHPEIKRLAAPAVRQ